MRLSALAALRRDREHEQTKAVLLNFQQNNNVINVHIIVCKIVSNLS
jgi:hypothetical protein